MNEKSVEDVAAKKKKGHAVACPSLLMRAIWLREMRAWRGG